MAKLDFIDHSLSFETFSEIKMFLNREGIQLGQFDLNERALCFAQQETLTENERHDLLSDYAHLAQPYEKLKEFRQDIIFLHPGFPHYEFLVKKFGSLHFHYENEYWYMFGGVGHFGYLGINGLRFLVHVEPGEYISVPEGRWQWWASNIEEQFKAMRFFNTENKFVKFDISKESVSIDFC